MNDNSDKPTPPSAPWRIKLNDAPPVVPDAPKLTTTPAKPPLAIRIAHDALGVVGAGATLAAIYSLVMHWVHHG